MLVGHRQVRLCCCCCRTEDESQTQKRANPHMRLIAMRRGPLRWHRGIATPRHHLGHGSKYARPQWWACPLATSAPSRRTPLGGLPRGNASGPLGTSNDEGSCAPAPQICCHAFQGNRAGSRAGSPPEVCSGLLPGYGTARRRTAYMRRCAGSIPPDMDAVNCQREERETTVHQTYCSTKCAVPLRTISSMFRRPPTCSIFPRPHRAKATFRRRVATSASARRSEHGGR